MLTALQQWLASLEPLDWITFLLGVVAGGTAVYLISVVRRRKIERALHDAETELTIRGEVERERERSHALAREQLSDSFGHLSQEALRYNSEAFLALAQQRFQRQSDVASNDLKAREKSIEALLSPVQEALKKAEAQIESIERERRVSFGALEQQLRAVTESQQSLQAETRNLVTALRRPEVRGRWGEVTLKRLAELAGMAEHCDFDEQVTIAKGEASLRPDMVVNLPDERCVVVDVKTPLDAYLTALEAEDDRAKEASLDRHAKNLRQRVRELSAKDYWAQFEQSPDFVVLFIPGEQFLSAALLRDKTLLEDALKQRVIVATPTSFIAILRAVAFSWRQLELVRNAKTIRRSAEEFHDRVSVFVGHFNKLGKSLGGSVEAFNRTLGSLERKLLPSARRLKELGVGGNKVVEDTATVDSKPQSMEDPADGSLR